MFFYLKTFKEGIFEGQEISNEYFIFEPKKNLELTIHKEDLNKKKEGDHALKIKITDFDDNGFSFVEFNEIENKYGEPKRINLGEVIKTTVIYSFVALYLKYSTSDIYIRLETPDYLLDVSKYLNPDVYEMLFDKLPEYREKLMPKLLSEGNMDTLYYIYKDGKLGVEKDEVRAFSYIVKERNFDEFLKWYNHCEDLKLMDHVLPVSEIFSFEKEYAYWIGRYKLDHGDPDGITYLDGILKLFIRDGYMEEEIYTHALAAFDVVKFVTEHNAYDDFDKLKLHFESDTGFEDVTLWMIYGCYLTAMDNFEKGGKKTCKEIYDFFPEELYYTMSAYGFAPEAYLNKNKALERVMLARELGDKYAQAMLDHYKL